MKKILIVDDNDFIRALITQILQEAGFETEECADGIEAIAKLQVSEYGLLITDIVMPNSSGVAVISHVKKQKLALPVLVVSSHMNACEAGNILAYAKQYANEALPKPFRKEDLLAAVGRISASA